MAKRNKSGKILVRIGADARKRAARNEAIAKAQSDRAIRKAAKKAATALRRSQRAIARRAQMLARKMARDRATQARRQAKRERDRQRRENGLRPKRKRPWHPRGPYATEKYTSYARRAERAKGLKGNRISPTICMVNGYTVRYSGDKAISCTCDDFTQGTWVGSAAGPFNPCKHMMAECPMKKWKCTNGVCSQVSTGGVYNTQAECIAALIPASFTGGQCVTTYSVTVTGYVTLIANNQNTASIRPTASGIGPIGSIYVEYEPPSPEDNRDEYYLIINFSNYQYREGIAGGVPNSSDQYTWGTENIVIIRPDGLPDDCGNPGPRCPP